MRAPDDLVSVGPQSGAVSEVAVLPRLTEEQSHQFVEHVWRFFCSLRLTLANLLGLFLAMIAGTFVNPANDSLTNIERAFAGRPWVLASYRWFELYDLFHSWWFTLLLTSLALNLIACSFERLPRIFYLVRWPERRLDHVVGLRFKVPPAPSTLGPEETAAVLRESGYSVQLGEGDLFAEKGRYSRFGVWVVHISLLLILGGGIVGRLTAFEGVAEVPQNGGQIDGFTEKRPDGTAFKHKLGFLVRCDDFRLKEFEPGRPKAFESDLRVFEQLPNGEAGRELSKATITVNHPLKWAGLTFYQASYRQLEESMRAKVRLADKVTHEERELLVGPGEKIEAADGLTYQLVNYEENFASSGPAVQVIREEQTGGGQVQTSSFWVFAKSPDFDRDNRDDRFSFRFERLSPFYATGLQIARDPSTPVVYTGCFMLFLGIGIAFYTSHKRIWAKFTEGRISLGGAAHRNAEAFSQEFDALCAKLSLPLPARKKADGPVAQPRALGR
jgi:cytochrome c biogenesis protein